jgi:hypothetical protein
MVAYKWYNVHKVDYVWGGWGGTKLYDAKNRVCPVREMCQQLHVDKSYFILIKLLI